MSNDLIITFLNGGLANQTFQYIFYRFLQLSRGSAEGVYMDDSFFYTHRIHNGYELEKVFGVKPALLSGLFDDDVWAEMIEQKKAGRSIPQQLLDMGEPINVLTESDTLQEFNPYSGEVYTAKGGCNRFHPRLAELEGEWYLHFYGLNTGYFLQFRDVLKEELSFKPFTEPQNIDIQARLLSEDSICLHVRRGDFVDIGRAVEPKYYREALEKLLEGHSGALLAVFSDDLGWCRDHADELGISLADKVLYVEGNRGESSFRDLQLMSLCRGMVITDSSFCMLAALLNDRLTRFVNLSGADFGWKLGGLAKQENN